MATNDGLDLITQALKKAGIVGVGRVPTATEKNDAIADLNDMLAEWATQRWMVWGLLDVGFTSTGANSYTVGPGGNFSITPRPNRLDYAYQRQVNNNGLPVDTPLSIIPSREEYAALSLKTLTSFGLYAFLDTSDYAMATLYLYPIPNATIYQIHILVKNVIPVVVLGTVLNVPASYIAAIKFNLARRLRQAYGKGLKPDPELNRLASSTLDVVKQSNIQIPELVMPKMLVRATSGYNILSDQFGSGGG